MATASSEARPEESVIDRFSSLPNEIADSILSPLSFKDLTRFGCVSKKCRGFSLSTPSLNFKDFSDVDLSICARRKMVLDSLDRFLTQRGNNRIKCFSFCWHAHFVDDGDEYELSECYCDDKNLRLNTWLGNAVTCNVEEIHLVITSPEGGFQRLPISLLECGSLRSLIVDMKCMIYEPSLDSLSNIEYMKLKNVVQVGDGFWKWISDCCKSIKELHLEDVSGINDLTIESSSLKSFSFLFGDLLHASSCSINISGDRLEKIHIDCFRDQKKFNFSAPNLKYLKWFGNFGTHRNLGDLMCLEKAEIGANFCNFDVLFDFLCSIRMVEVLILNGSIVKAFSKENCMPLQLDRVNCLCIQACNLDDALVPGLLYLLKGVPNMISLGMTSIPLLRITESDFSGFNMDFWKLQGLAFISQIKVVALELYNGSNVVEFARYILEHAPNLKKVVIIHFPDQLETVMKLKGKMISSATVSFHEKERFRSTLMPLMNAFDELK